MVGSRGRCFVQDLFGGVPLRVQQSDVSSSAYLPGVIRLADELINAARAGYTSIPVEISAIYRSAARPSHFRPVRDIFLIGRMIWWSILSRGFNIRGLIRSLRAPARSPRSNPA